jgi:pyruvate formate lyase activating enzyme
MVKEASYYEWNGRDIRCRLCPHFCLIGEGSTGLCKVRRHNSNKLIAESWGRISSLHTDPVEKKPLYHFYPGRCILSIGSVGCNMHCNCCQNWQISQVSIRDFNFSAVIPPEKMLELILADKESIGIAYTYNEPSIGFEYVVDLAQMVSSGGLKNVMVSNGYISEAPLRQLLHYMDALNIDLKGFNDKIYRSFTGATLTPVLETLKIIRNAGRHLEITCLIIPGVNDDTGDFKKMISWIADNLGNNTVLHLSKYFPGYRLTTPPTSADTLENLLNIAHEKLFHVYAGNIQLKEYQNTRCFSCGETIIRRNGYHTMITGLSKEGRCIKCGYQEIIC